MTLTQHNTEQLVKLCLTKNTLAQLELYNRYYKAMYNTAVRIVKNSDEAEDIMQEAFIQAFTKLNSLNDLKTFGAWLKRIVINKSIYSFNKQAKQDTGRLDDVLYKVEDNDTGISSTDSTNEKVKTILKTMETLHDNYRVALTLHLIEGYDYEEMGQILNKSYASCRTLVSRAKDSLRAKLTIPQQSNK